MVWLLFLFNSKIEKCLQMEKELRHTKHSVRSIIYAGVYKLERCLFWVFLFHLWNAARKLPLLPTENFYSIHFLIFDLIFHLSNLFYLVSWQKCFVYFWNNLSKNPPPLFYKWHYPSIQKYILPYTQGVTRWSCYSDSWKTFRDFRYTKCSVSEHN